MTMAPDVNLDGAFLLDGLVVTHWGPGHREVIGGHLHAVVVAEDGEVALAEGGHVHARLHDTGARVGGVHGI